MGMRLQKMSLEAFLEWEEAQPTRNEYHRGEVFAMVGARRSHGVVAGNLARHLGNALEGSGCRAFHEGMKVQVADDTILYPDVFVTCDPADLRTDAIFRAPTLVVEVLSPTTQAYDRSQKFALYRRLESLQEFALVDPDTRRVEAFVKGADGLYVLHDFSDRESVSFASLDLRIPLAALFDGLDTAA